MAKHRIEVIQAVRATAEHLSRSDDYQWGHMGSCNCGFLGQQVTALDKAEIHRRALMRYGDWNEQLNDYCPTSGLPFDDIISELIGFGFDINDLKHLERLSDPAILNELPKGRFLKHNVKEDVIVYLNIWCQILECKIVDEIRLPASFEVVAEKVS